jgi:hypothetical protein
MLGFRTSQRLNIDRSFKLPENVQSYAITSVLLNVFARMKITPKLLVCSMFAGVTTGSNFFK